MNLIYKIVDLIYYYLVICILYLIYKIIAFVYKSLFQSKIDLVKKYGINSWVLITGASDGIGKSLCEEFAILGFNIILVARDVEKLNKVAGYLKSINKEIDTHVIVFDFSKKTDISDYEEIFESLKKFDISILVNNVGYAKAKKFLNTSHSEVYDMININITSCVLLTKIFLPYFSSRTNKGAIVNISSASEFYPLSYMAEYSSSKALMTYFSKGLSGEYKDIDIISVNPLGVHTNLNKLNIDNFVNISPKQCAMGIIKKIGHEYDTAGYYSHEILKNIMEFFRDNLIQTRPLDFLVEITMNFVMIKQRELELVELKNKSK